jgi:hypothetical protein
MTSSGKTGSKTVPRRAASKTKPTRSRKAKSSRSSGPKSSRTGTRGKAASSRQAKASSGKAASPARAAASKAASSGKAERLSAGGLDPLVLDYLKENKATAPHTPGQVAKGLGRSSGAVGNCLARLTDARKTKRVSDKPQRYTLAA